MDNFCWFTITFHFGKIKLWYFELEPLAVLKSRGSSILLIIYFVGYPKINPPRPGNATRELNVLTALLKA